EGFPMIALQNILDDHELLAVDINRRIKPLKYFSDYMKSGYYPLFLEGEDTYGMRLEETILMLLEVELPLLRHIDISYVIKLKQLLSIISESAPFAPNITRLSERIGINRQTLLGYLHNLEEAKLINTIYRKSRGLSALQKPDKIFLENTNLMHLFKGSLADKGNLRETFLCNQLKYDYELQYAEQGDFLVAGEYTIEVGGKNKTNKQIKDLNAAYIAADNLEYGYGNKIPLWLFGFLY
ncbi:MAG: AAA family ATPase, partial [Spirochaetota bacterium]|nr:AAA family ATPase [Spirochaetota bacterium]